jgi:hypothetical protein
MTLTREQAQVYLNYVAEMRELRDKQELCFKQLEFYARICLQGINPDDIQGYCLKYNTNYKEPEVYDAVRLKDGTKLALNPHIPKKSW